MNKLVEETTKRPISKALYKVPEIIGVSIFLGLIGIQIPMFILAILAPDYEVTFEKVMPGWLVVCLVGTLLYYRKNDWNAPK